MFDKFPLSPEEEYWVGYLRCDARIESYKTGERVLKFTQTTPESVEGLKKFLRTTQPVVVLPPKSGYRSERCYSLTTRKYAEELYELGTKEALTPSLYESAHFWRGMLDGKGGCRYVKFSGKKMPHLYWRGSHYDMTRLSVWLSRWLSEQDAPESYPNVVTHGQYSHSVDLLDYFAVELGLYLYQGQYSVVRDYRDTALSFSEWAG